MIKVPLIEIIFRTIPEAFIFMLGMYVFSHTKIDKIKYILTSTYLTMGVIFIRSLPISYGIHTILIIILSIFLISSVGKVEVTKATTVGVVMALILSVVEWLNIILIQYGFKQDVEIVMANSISKVIYGMPSMAIMLMVICMYKWKGQIWFKKRKRRE